MNAEEIIAFQTIHRLLKESATKTDSEVYKCIAPGYIVLIILGVFDKHCLFETWDQMKIRVLAEIKKLPVIDNIYATFREGDADASLLYVVEHVFRITVVCLRNRKIGKISIPLPSKASGG